MEGNINEEEQSREIKEFSDSENVRKEIDEKSDEEQDFLDSDISNYEEAEDEKYLEDDELPDLGGMNQSQLGGIYGLFREVLGKKDSKKVSYLTNEELGDCDFNVRDCESISLLADTFGHPDVAEYFNSRSRIITDTAMSRKGWFTELFVTSKKYAARDSSSSINNLPQFQKKNKWKLFSKKDNQQEMNNPQM